VNIIDLFQSFKTQEQALGHLEKIRWRGKPVCPYCKCEKVSRHASGDRAMQRWQCQSCTRAFAVTVGTIFHGTHIPLKNWFLVLALMLNAKKSASAYQISRDLGMRRATVWSMMHRARIAMSRDPAQNTLLHGIVEADETFVGGKPRKGNRRDGDGGDTIGRPRKGSSKIVVMGLMERGGRVVAQPSGGPGGKVNAKSLSKFISKFVDRQASILMTDENPAYLGIGGTMRHAAINHKLAYADGFVHTNSIEGFWSLVKRAWYGSHHHYSPKYMNLYISEACFKFNRRTDCNAFDGMLGIMVGA
jgi:transposase-like protein